MDIGDSKADLKDFTDKRVFTDKKLCGLQTDSFIQVNGYVFFLQ